MLKFARLQSSVLSACSAFQQALLLLVRFSVAQDLLVWFKTVQETQLFMQYFEALLSMEYFESLRSMEYFEALQSVDCSAIKSSVVFLRSLL